MLSKFVIGGVALLAIVSSFVGTNLSFVTTDSSNSVAKELFFSDLDRKNSQFLITYGKLTDSWESYQKTEENNWDSTILYRALEYASKKHKGQIRKDPYKTPYIVHPMGVAKILWEEGNVRDVDVLVAALLHDTLEDTDATEFEIEGIFGSRVLSIVKEVSNDPRLSGQENKQRQIELAPFMSQEAKLVKLADRLCNIRDLQRSTPLNWSKEDIEHYFSWGEKLVRAFAGTDEQLENALKWELSHPTSGKSTAISKSLALG
jgi:(p)ppGpp synthase/HD superfamily hydrolase